MNNRNLISLLLLPVLVWQFLLWNSAKAQPASEAVNEGGVHHDASALVSGGNGDVIVVWRSLTSDGSAVFAQKLDAQGRNLWKDGVEVCSQPVDDVHFSAVTDAHGGLIIFWEDSREGKYNTNIYAQRIDADGKMLWSSDGVPVCTAGHQQILPQAVVDQHGGAYAFWTDYREGNADIYGCHMDAAGKVIHTFAVCTRKEDQMHLAVAPTPSGGACVVWIDHRYDEPGIYAEFVNAHDSLEWRADGLPVCTGLYQPDMPSVISTSGGRFLITWSDYRSRVARVFLQLLNADGMEVPPSNGLSVTRSAGPQYSPTICATGSSKAAVTWLQYGKGAGMFQQQMELSGSIKLNPEVSITDPSLAQLWATSAADGRRGVVTVWLKYAGDKTEVFAQRTGPDNHLKWGKSGEPIGTAGGETHPSIAASEAGNVVFVSWTTFSPDSSEITVIGLDRAGKKIWMRHL